MRPSAYGSTCLQRSYRSRTATIDYRIYHAINTFVYTHGWLGSTTVLLERWALPIIALAVASLWFLARPGAGHKWKLASLSALLAAVGALLANLAVAAYGRGRGPSSRTRPRMSGEAAPPIPPFPAIMQASHLRSRSPSSSSTGWPAHCFLPLPSLSAQDAFSSVSTIRPMSAQASWSGPPQRGQPPGGRVHCSYHSSDSSSEPPRAPAHTMHAISPRPPSADIDEAVRYR